MTHNYAHIRGLRVAIVYPEAIEIARFKEKRKEFPPFGPLYLAAILEENGCDVSIIKISNNRYAIDFRDFDAVGFSLSSSAEFDLFRKCREESKFSHGQLLMAGGVHAHLFPQQSLIDLKVDVLCYGEGEQAILEILHAYTSKTSMNNILGILYIQDGCLKKTAPRPISKYIDGLPMPARHLFDKDDIFMKDRLAGTNANLAHVMFSRGCPFICAYCAVAQTKMQYRRGANCRAELELLKSNYGIDGFAIVDDNFIINEKIVREISKSIKGLGLKWSALSRVDMVNPSLLQNLAEAGCIEIKFGVESGDESLLTRMKKNTTVAQIENALIAASEAGIKSKIFIIHGFPGENERTTDRTIALMEKNRRFISRVSVFRFVPLPGTHVYRYPDEYGVRGTRMGNGWDGRWSRFHIHHNDQHWWGDTRDYREMNRAYSRLIDFVDSNWSEKF